MYAAIWVSSNEGCRPKITTLTPIDHTAHGVVRQTHASRTKAERSVPRSRTKPQHSFLPWDMTMSESIRDFSEFYGFRFEELRVGQSSAISRTVTDADILMFAGVSGDTNPVHLDGEFASNTMFGSRIAHGMLSASYVSAVFGTRLPGPGCIYLSQELKFRAPVHVGDTVVARVTVKELKSERRRAIFSTECKVGDKLVLEGDAEILIPAR